MGGFQIFQSRDFTLFLTLLSMGRGGGNRKGLIRRKVFKPRGRGKCAINYYYVVTQSQATPCGVAVLCF